ncbi:MAG: hypothetical protein ACAI25_02690, partial [Planctomycetota bacterium]
VKNVATGATDNAKLTRVEKIALLYALGGKPGAEADVLVELDGKLTPVELHWDGATISFKVGEAREKLYGKPSATKEEIQKKYGIGAFVDEDAKWDDDMLFVVETALASLSKEELEGVAGLPFHRMKASSSKSLRGAAAMYVPEKQRIELYDHAIEGDRRKFMGTVEKPVPRSTFALVHECGHAISRHGARDLRAKAVTTKKEFDDLQAKLIEERKLYNEEKAAKKPVDERAATIKQLQADVAEKKKAFDAVAAAMVAGEKQGSALERAFDAKLPFKKSATPYGRTAIGDSYAECFALFKLDRAALERAAPGTPAFFESPDYVGLLKGP